MGTYIETETNKEKDPHAQERANSLMITSEKTNQQSILVLGDIDRDYDEVEFKIELNDPKEGVVYIEGFGIEDMQEELEDNIRNNVIVPIGRFFGFSTLIGAWKLYNLVKREAKSKPYFPDKDLFDFTPRKPIEINHEYKFPRRKFLGYAGGIALLALLPNALSKIQQEYDQTDELGLILDKVDRTLNSPDRESSRAKFLSFIEAYKYLSLLQDGGIYSNWLNNMEVKTLSSDYLETIDIVKDVINGELSLSKMESMIVDIWKRSKDRIIRETDSLEDFSSLTLVRKKGEEIQRLSFSVEFLKNTLSL